MTALDWATFGEKIVGIITSSLSPALTVFLLVQSSRNRKTHLANAAVVAETAIAVAAVKVDVADVKRETNHMKDALVAAEKSVSFTAGATEQRDSAPGIVVTAPAPPSA